MWVGLISVGMRIIFAYENTPGITDALPQRWPASAQIQPLPDQATLVMIAHPHCSCTRASIEELSVLMTHVQGRVTAYILFLKPPEFPAGWEKTDLWEHAAAIPGVHVISDEGGSEARRFHATISGQVLLYDTDGKLLFSGGITGSRGHTGDNAGRGSIFSLLTKGAAERAETFVFGCALFADLGERTQQNVGNQEVEAP